MPSNFLTNIHCTSVTVTIAMNTELADSKDHNPLFVGIFCLFWRWWCQWYTDKWNFWHWSFSNFKVIFQLTKGTDQTDWTMRILPYWVWWGIPQCYNANLTSPMASVLKYIISMQLTHSASSISWLHQCWLIIAGTCRYIASVCDIIEYLAAYM